MVIGLIAGLSFMAGIMFLLLGAWPVMPFLGLDVVLIYWAFRANYRAAAAYEEVTVTPSELHVKKVSARGKVAEWSLNPVWVRLERETHEEFGLMRLFLVSQGASSPSRAFSGRPKRKASPRRFRRRDRRGEARTDTESAPSSVGEIGWFWHSQGTR